MVAWTIWPGSTSCSNLCWLISLLSESKRSLESISRMIPPKTASQTIQARDRVRPSPPVLGLMPLASPLQSSDMLCLVGPVLPRRVSGSIPMRGVFPSPRLSCRLALANGCGLVADVEERELGRLEEAKATKYEATHPDKPQGNTQPGQHAEPKAPLKGSHPCPQQRDQGSRSKRSQGNIDETQGLQKQGCLPFDAIHLFNQASRFFFRRFASFRLGKQLVHAVARPQHPVDRAQRQHTRGVVEQSGLRHKRQCRERALCHWAWIHFVIKCLLSRLRHSCLNASTGSISAARMAGERPRRMPTMAEMEKAMRGDQRGGMGFMPGNQVKSSGGG